MNLLALPSCRNRDVPDHWCSAGVHGACLRAHAACLAPLRRITFDLASTVAKGSMIRPVLEKRGHPFDATRHFLITAAHQSP